MEKVGNASIKNCNSEEKSRSVILSSKLFNLIASVKDIQLVTNVKEILDGLKKYICVKQLYDPQNPRRISCKSDELGSVFGVQEFSILEVASFLPKLIFPVNSEAISSNSVGNNKRKCEETCTAAKKNKLLAVEETYNIEYEEDSIFFAFSDSSTPSYSDISDSHSETDLLVCKNDSDMEFWADKSSDDEICANDAEISDSDKWVCAACSTLNDPPNRFCERCFKTRKGWLSSKRKIKKRKSRSERKRVFKISEILNKNKESTTPTTKNSRIKIFNFPSTSSSSPSSQENKSQECTEKGMQHSNNLSFDSYSNSSKLCIFCCDRPANGTIIHANTKYAHTIACYPCARKLKDGKKTCPICRRRIDRVVYEMCL